MTARTVGGQWATGPRVTGPRPRERRRIRGRVGLGAVAILLAGGCGQSTPPVTPIPTATRTAPPAAPASVAPLPSPDVAWVVADVAQPSAVTDAPSVAPGQFCSPCHPAAESQLFGVAATSDGLVAVGVQQPPAVAVAFESHDGSRWQPASGFAPGLGTSALGVASGAGRTIVVGRDDAGAAAWIRDAAATWRAATGVDLAGPAGATAMTSVAAVGGSFLAGGYSDDPARGTTAAAAWRSTDGQAWRRERSAAFDGGRIEGVAGGPRGVVAVGTRGDPVRGPAAAWVRSANGTWQRATIDDEAGVMRAVVAVGTGFVAVGDDPGDRTAAVWRSADGTSWTRLPPDAALRTPSGPIRMLSVAGDGRGLVATGWRSDAANGSAVAWLSDDGTRWRQTDWLPSFSGGQMAAVAIVGQTLVAAGRTGYPDNNQATIWTTSRPYPPR
ncbi:MAG TPA: hypothetical protein VFS32_01565 [Candidatus Limnocylindrales bacterium]|nr:hypothetical protein [Candidatus Limnocylindrales bacterium]